MYLPKESLFNLLNTLKKSDTNPTGIDGLKVYQTFPDVFESLPTITFSVNNNMVEQDLSKNILYQDITFTIDIWGDTSSQCSDVLDKMESLLRDNNYKLTYSADVPNTDKNVRHIANRFTLII